MRECAAAPLAMLLTSKAWSASSNNEPRAAATFPDGKGRAAAVAMSPASRCVHFLINRRSDCEEIHFATQLASLVRFSAERRAALVVSVGAAKLRFGAEGISIPYLQHDIHLVQAIP